MISHRSAPRRLDTALELLANDLAPASTLARVQSIWDQVAGPQVAHTARPTQEHEGVLTVACCSASWAQEIDLMSAELLNRLNDRLAGRPIERLRCRVE